MNQQSRSYATGRKKEAKTILNKLYTKYRKTINQVSVGIGWHYATLVPKYHGGPFKISTLNRWYSDQQTQCPKMNSLIALKRYLEQVQAETQEHSTQPLLAPVGAVAPISPRLPLPIPPVVSTDPISENIRAAVFGDRERPKRSEDATALIAMVMDLPIQERCDVIKAVVDGIRDWVGGA